MKKIFLFIVLALLPVTALAQTATAQDKIFKAAVVEVLREQKITASDGGQTTQQNLKLKGLEGDFNEQVVEYHGIGNIELVKKHVYKAGDKVLVMASLDDQGNYTFYVTDYDRSTSLVVLAIIFLVCILGVGGWKGFRSVLSLVLSFLVIMKYIVPQIIDGADPIIVTLIGSCLILVAVIYLTEGFKRSAHIGATSIFISLTITVILSQLFVSLARLSGLSSEETGFLVGATKYAINFQGLLMAGIIIGALGVLDDVVISQVATVEELHKLDPYLGKLELFKRGFKVGVSHISSMTNTLFLAYSGASLSVLILFSTGQSGFSGWGQVVNNEMIATEIVRTLAGSVGLILAVPISTLVAAWWVKKA